MRDDFFDKRACDRCGGGLAVRTTSWFTKETICMKCADAESVIKKALRDQGKSDMEGCGYVPKLTDEQSKETDSQDVETGEAGSVG